VTENPGTSFLFHNNPDTYNNARRIFLQPILLCMPITHTHTRVARRIRNDEYILRSRKSSARTYKWLNAFNENLCRMRRTPSDLPSFRGAPEELRASVGNDNATAEISPEFREKTATGGGEGGRCTGKQRNGASRKRFYRACVSTINARPLFDQNK